jgi:hypothetical protein
MDINQAAMFLSGSILIALSFIVLVIAAVVINNIIHKYWKPIKVLQFYQYPEHTEPKVEPVVEVEKRTKG